WRIEIVRSYVVGAGPMHAQTARSRRHDKSATWRLYRGSSPRPRQLQNRLISKFAAVRMLIPRGTKRRKSGGEKLRRQEPEGIASEINAYGLVLSVLQKIYEKVTESILA